MSFSGRCLLSKILTFAFVVLMVAPVQSMSAEFSVPLQKQKFGFFVEVALNKNVRVNLLVDTGSTFVVISEKVAQKLGLGDLAKLPRYPISTIAGVKWARLAVLDEVLVGGAKTNSVEVAIVETLGGGVEGLLGASFLKDFVYTIDGPGLTLLLKLSNNGKLYGGHDEKWWRGRHTKYSKAVKKYENWADMLKSGFHRTKTETGEDFSMREVTALIVHYKQLLANLHLRASAFGVPLPWVNKR